MSLIFKVVFKTYNVIGTDVAGNIFAGGIFFQAGGTNISRIARYGDEAVPTEDLTSDYPDFRAYPNPTTGRVVLAGTHLPEGARVRIRNAAGVVVRQQQLRGTQVDLAGLPAGWYLLSCELGDRVAVVKVVVESGQ